MPLGTLDGALVLLPYTSDAAEGFNSAADAKMALAKALNNTKNCGLSGSNEALLDVAKGTEKLAQAFAALSNALMNETNDDGQLRLLSGNISKITDQIKNSANVLDSLGEKVRTLIKNIDTESLDGVDKLVASLDNLVKYSVDFNQAFMNLKGLSKLLLKLGSLVTGFTDSVHNFSDSFKAETEATKAAEERCNVSTGLPKALNNFAEISNTIYENLLLL